MRMCRVIAVFVVFEGFGKLRSTFCNLRILFFGFETWEGSFAWIGKGSLSWTWIWKGFGIQILKNDVFGA